MWRQSGALVDQQRDRRTESELGLRCGAYAHPFSNTFSSGRDAANAVGTNLWLRARHKACAFLCGSGFGSGYTTAFLKYAAHTKVRFTLPLRAEACHVCAAVGN